MGGEAVVEAGRIRSQHIALLVGQELLDRVSLLDVCDVPVPDSFPGGVRVAAENQLAARGVDLQQLRPVSMAAERWVYHQARRNLETSVDDDCLAAHDLALDFREGLRRVSANRAPRAGLRRRSYSLTSDRIDGIYGADMSVIELDRVVDEEVDLIQLLLLDVQDSIRERVELAGVVPVTMSNNDPGDIIRIQPDVFHLVGEVPPAARGVPIKDISQLLPPAVIQSDLAVLALDDSDIGRKVEEGDIVPGVGTARDERPVRHK